MIGLHVTVLAILLLATGYGDCRRLFKKENELLKEAPCVCVKANRLNARDNPGLESTVITVLKKNDCFTFSGLSLRQNGYTWLNIQTSARQDLWVASEYMASSSPSSGGTPSSSEGCGVDDQCPGISMVTREEWNARPPKSISNMSVPVDLVFIHHTAMDQCFTLPSCSAEMRTIQDFHMDDRGWDDIGYNFLVGGDGRVYIGRGWDRVGAHTYGYNDKSVAISFMGNYMTQAPPERMLNAAQNLIQCGIDQGYIRSNYSLHGHRDVRCTDCPGDVLYRIAGTWPHWHDQMLPPPICTTTTSTAAATTDNN